MQFTLVNICPPQGNHQALAEIKETVYFSLRSLGYVCEIIEPLDLFDRAKILPQDNHYYIIFGCNSNPLYETPFPLPVNSILYNFEQIYAKSPWLRAGYIDYLCQYPLWDYSLANIAKLKQLGIHHVVHVPVGYVPEMTRISAHNQQDIDVLFYGSINDRRQSILDQLTEQGLKVKTLFGIYRQTIAHRGFQLIQSCPAQAYLQQGIQALPTLRQMVQPVNPPRLFIRDFYRKYLAKNAFYQGDYPKAIGLYEETLEVDPSCLESYWNLGLVLRCLGDELTGDMVWSSGLEAETEELTPAADRLTSLRHFLYTERQRQIDLQLSDRHPEILNAIQKSLTLMDQLSPENEKI